MPSQYQPEYAAWRRMIRRCLDPTDKDWKNYGGRGVKVCPQWLNSFPTFLKDVGSKPAPDRLLWLGRRDIQGNYEPGNVAWLSHQRQISHRRYCHRISLDGGSLTIQEAGRQIERRRRTQRDEGHGFLGGRARRRPGLVLLTASNI